MDRKTSTAHKALEIKVQIVAGIEMGVPSKKCKNFGICRIIPFGSEASFTSCKTCQCKGIITLFQNGAVELAILKSTLDRKDFEYYFGSTRFLVEEDYYFTDEGRLDSDFIVKAGSYPISMDHSFVKVVFH